MATTIKFTKMQGAGNDYILRKHPKAPHSRPRENFHQMELVTRGSVPTGWH